MATRLALALSLVLIFSWAGIVARDARGGAVAASTLENPLSYMGEGGYAPYSLGYIGYYLTQGSFDVTVYVPPCTEGEVRVYRAGDRELVASWRLEGGAAPRSLEAEAALPGYYLVVYSITAGGGECPLHVPPGSFSIYQEAQPEVGVRAVVLAGSLASLAAGIAGLLRGGRGDGRS